MPYGPRNLMRHTCRQFRPVVGESDRGGNTYTFGSQAVVQSGDSEDGTFACLANYLGSETVELAGGPVQRQRWAVYMDVREVKQGDAFTPSNVPGDVSLYHLDGDITNNPGTVINIGLFMLVPCVSGPAVVVGSEASL